jgi:hypothetical protein
MNNEDPILPLGNTTIVVTGDGTRTFRLETATLLPRGKHRVRLVFEGPEVVVTVNLPRVVFWRITSVLHDASIAGDAAGPKKPTPRTPRKGS